MAAQQTQETERSPLSCIGRSSPIVVSGEASQQVGCKVTIDEVGAHRSLAS
jgi:hypothetical protein